MNKSIALVLGLLAVLFLCVVALKPAKADSPPGFVRISADGSVIGTDKIQRNGNIYIFTGNISGGIAIEKNSVVIDGAGYTLQGPGSEALGDGGIFLDFRSNVVIKNLHITDCPIGIRNQFGNCTFEGNYITNCGTAISMLGVYGNNTFIGNTITSSVLFSLGGGGNYFFGNNFLEGGWVQGGFAAGKNVFDGNYWSTYNGTDDNRDGIGDTPYVVYEDCVNNNPLMKAVVTSWLPYLRHPRHQNFNRPHSFL